MQEIDTLIVAAHVVPVMPRGTLVDHAVAIDAGHIIAVLPAAQAQSRFTARSTVHLQRHALIPGLVNLHCHVAMTLMRGFADDLPLQEWLSGHIWPAEARHVNDEFVHDGSLLGLAEMIRGGVTCVPERLRAGRAGLPRQGPRDA
jgi:5-methylthioadenosine/S-adenosylhomocysteine deaminase